MTERFAAVLSLPGLMSAAPPGADRDAFRLALLEDTYEVAADMGEVTAALALGPGEQSDVQACVWPGTPVLDLSASKATAAATPDIVLGVLGGLAELGADEGVVLAPDAPDLPIMLLGKLFQALEDGDVADVAACPAEGGGLVALASRLPAPEWLTAAGVGLDTDDALARLRAAAPSRRALGVSPGWRRLRRREDISRLDPGLEGWEATRALLSGR